AVVRRQKKRCFMVPFRRSIRDYVATAVACRAPFRQRSRNSNMRGLALPLAALILLPLSARADDPATPWDMRIPVRFGAGGTTMWGGSPGFSVSFGGVMIGR